MLSLSLLTVVGLVVVAATDPHDFSRLCSSPAPGGECPAGWRNVGGDCLKFMSGWDQAKAKEVCREEGAEYIDFLFLLPVCLVRRETQCQCGRTNSVTKTEFGVEIEKEEYPWEVRLSTSRDPSITCGGSIINRDEILTAANCTEGNSVDSITVITNDERADVEVSHLVCSKREHPDEDLAVLTLCEPLMFSKAVGPVCLPEPVQEKLARLILARLPASILSTKICNEDRDGSPLAVMGADGRYTQLAVGCTEQGDDWFYIKYSSLKNWINLSTSSPASTTTTTSITTTSTPASTTTTTTTSTPASTTTTTTTSTPASTTTTTTTSTTASVPGFIITGGSSRAAWKKVEIFNPLNRHTCSLPDLPEGMAGHSQCGNLLCYDKSCLKMNPTGSFSPAPVSLLQRRSSHLCWSLPGGGGEVMLLGGGWSVAKTTEVISSNFNSSKPSWDLKYNASRACGVEVDDTFIITGGRDYYAPDGTLNSVVRYNSQGESEVLPSLTVGRCWHACASYLNSNGKLVVLVTGGVRVFNRGKGKFHYSTELMVDFKPWRPAANLGFPIYALRAATLDNKVFLFGGNSKAHDALDFILSYEPDTDTWHKAGTMTVGRANHAVAVRPDVSQLCP